MAYITIKIKRQNHTVTLSQLPINMILLNILKSMKTPISLVLLFIIFHLTIAVRPINTPPVIISTPHNIKLKA